MKLNQEVTNNSSYTGPPIRMLYLDGSCCFYFLLFTQIQALNHKIIELKGIKRPSLKRVKKTTDDMLGAYTDNSRLMKADFKANLKTVKKEDEKVRKKGKMKLCVRNLIENRLQFICLFSRGKK